MKTTDEYINIIHECANELKEHYGVRSLRIFGSVSRGEQNENSDVDIFVDMEPKLYQIVALKRYLETRLDSHVDIIRNHKHINPYLINEIRKDGIDVI